ncbi:MAG: HD family phosphohydrolase [Eubacterium sp.]|nr:HD family phosphohydrolase [Eubacterium sp.]
MNNHKVEQQEAAEELLSRLSADRRAQRMKHFIQHGHVTTYDHCLAVTRMSCRIAKDLHVKVDWKSLVRSSFLHDYYLYDWHSHGDHLHGYHHPEIAAENAARDFNLSDKEQSIIRSHMWPLTFFHFPTCREAVIVTIADKIVSAGETIRR